MSHLQTIPIWSGWIIIVWPSWLSPSLCLIRMSPLVLTPTSTSYAFIKKPPALSAARLRRREAYTRVRVRQRRRARFAGESRSDYASSFYPVSSLPSNHLLGEGLVDVGLHFLLGAVGCADHAADRGLAGVVKAQEVFEHAVWVAGLGGEVSDEH